MPENTKEWFNITEVSIIFDVDKTTVTRLITEGKLRAKDFSGNSSQRRFFKVHRQWVEEFKEDVSK